MEESETPVLIPDTGKPYADISLGWKHTCALTAMGEVFCWGSNGHGELGNNSLTESSTPVFIPKLKGIKKITSGTSHNCSLDENGVVKCWGDNYYGQAGCVDCPTEQFSPRDVSLPGPAIDISSGGSNNCALLENGDIYCWGSNDKCQSGDNTSIYNSFVYKTLPTKIIFPE